MALSVGFSQSPFSDPSVVFSRERSTIAASRRVVRVSLVIVLVLYVLSSADGTGLSEMQAQPSLHSTNLVPQIGHYSSVMSLAYSPDGKRIASGDWDKAVRIWDADTGELVTVLLGHEAAVRALAYSPDGTHVVSGSVDTTVRVWNISTGASRVLKGHQGSVYSLSYSPNGEYLASGSVDTTIRVWNISTGASRVLKGHQGSVYSLSYSPNGEYLASGSVDTTIRVWDITTGETTVVLEGHRDAVYSLAYSPDGNDIASGGSDSTVRIWDVSTANNWLVLSSHQRDVVAVTYSRNGKRIMSGSMDQTVRTWDIKRGRFLSVLSLSGDSVDEVAFSPDGSSVASGSRFGDLRLWNVSTGELKKTLHRSSDAIFALASNSDGTRITSRGSDRIWTWDTSTGESLAVIDVTSRAAAYSHDGAYIVTGSDDGKLTVWNVSKSEQTDVFEGNGGAITSLAYSRDGKYIASGHGDGRVRVWGASIGSREMLLTGHESYIQKLAFSWDGGQIASGSRDTGSQTTVRVWDTATGQLAATITDMEVGVLEIAYSHDLTRIAFGTVNGQVRIWDGLTGEVVRVIKAHVAAVNALAYSPDGRKIASGGEDGNVRIWEIETGREVASVRHGSEVSALVYTPDGRLIISSGDGGTIRMWIAETQQLDLVLQSLTNRNWISYRPSHLVYTGSAGAESQVRIRFDGAPCHIFRIVHRSRQCPVYEMESYRRELRQDPEELRSALAGPLPRVRPNELAEVWERIDGGGRMILVIAFVGCVSLFAIAVVFRVRYDRLAIAKSFFGETYYHSHRQINEYALLLRETDDPSRAAHYAVLADGGSDLGTRVRAAVAKRITRSEGHSLLYLLYPAVDATGRRNQIQEARDIKNACRLDTIPLELSVMRRALENGACDATLDEANDRYVTRIDPYREVDPVTDPYLFFGRDAELETIPALLSQGQHVGIFGLRKTGKTSLANQVQLRLSGSPITRISCQEMDGEAAERYLARIAEGIAGTVSSACAVSARVKDSADYGATIRGLLASWRESGRSQPIILMMDEIETLMPIDGEDAEDGREGEGGWRKEDLYRTLVEGRRVLGLLRALAQETQALALLVIGYRPNVNRVNRLPFNAGENPMFMGFHETYCGFLSGEESDTMIREIGAWRGIAWERSSLSRVYYYCGGHPYITRLFASDVYKQDGRGRELNAWSTLAVKEVMVERTALEIERNMRSHEIGSVYDSIAELLNGDEKELLARIVASGEAVTEDELDREEERAVTSLESMGLVTVEGEILVSSELLRYWIDTRLVV